MYFDMSRAFQLVKSINTEVHACMRLVRTCVRAYVTQAVDHFTAHVFLLDTRFSVSSVPRPVYWTLTCTLTLHSELTCASCTRRPVHRLRPLKTGVGRLMFNASWLSTCATRYRRFPCLERPTWRTEPNVKWLTEARKRRTDEVDVCKCDCCFLLEDRNSMTHSGISRLLLHL